MPSLSWRFTSAPKPSSTDTHSEKPPYAAQWSGVRLCRGWSLNPTITTTITSPSSPLSLTPTNITHPHPIPISPHHHTISNQDIPSLICYIHWQSLMEEGGAQSGVATRGCPVQAGTLNGVSQLHRCPSIEQHDHCLCVAPLTRPKQGSKTVTVLCIDISSMLQVGGRGCKEGGWGWESWPAAITAHTQRCHSGPQHGGLHTKNTPIVMYHSTWRAAHKEYTKSNVPFNMEGCTQRIHQ